MKARAWVGLLGPVIVLGPACYEPPSETHPVCGPSDDPALVDALVFAELTATSWYQEGACNDPAPLPPTCNRLELRADGTFAWTAISDYVERDESGPWNFRPRDAESGVICFGGGSVMDYRLDATGLRWGLLGLFTPEAPLVEAGSREGLPAVEPSPLFTDLVATSWVKTNSLDLDSVATSFTLFEDGTFTAEYRDGECTHGGTFSVVGDELQPRNDDNFCRSGTPANLAASNERPVFDAAGRLVFYRGAYRDAGIETEERFLAFSNYGGDNGLYVTAEWTGDLALGAGTEWTLTVRNAGSMPQTVTWLGISLQGLVASGNGYTADGPEVMLIDDIITGVELAPGETWSTVEAFTPAAAPGTSPDWASLDIAVDSFDAGQPYSNARGFLLGM